MLLFESSDNKPTPQTTYWLDVEQFYNQVRGYDINMINKGVAYN